MIIATIIEYSHQADGGVSSANREVNGCSSTIFYAINDANNFALAMSRPILYGTVNETLYGLVVVYNTETDERRWWFNGVEYTG